MLGLFFGILSGKMNGALSSELSKLAAHMNKIERRLKEAEIIREEVVIAGINELRYAGRRFIDAWSIAAKDSITEEDAKELDRHLIVAAQYLENADHDVTDAICYFVHEQMKRYIKKYGINEIEKVSRDFIPFIRKMEGMNNIVSGSRESRPARKDAYDDLEKNYIPELLERYSIIQYSEPLVLAKNRKGKAWSAFWGFLAALTVVFGVVSGAIGILGWDGVIHLPWLSSESASKPPGTSDKDLSNPNPT